MEVFCLPMNLVKVTICLTQESKYKFSMRCTLSQFLYFILLLLREDVTWCFLPLPANTLYIVTIYNSSATCDELTTGSWREAIHFEILSVSRGAWGVNHSTLLLDVTSMKLLQSY